MKSALYKIEMFLSQNSSQKSVGVNKFSTLWKLRNFTATVQFLRNFPSNYWFTKKFTVQIDLTKKDLRGNKIIVFPHRVSHSSVES